MSAANLHLKGARGTRFVAMIPGGKGRETRGNQMKKLLVALAIAAGAVAFVPTEASAWTCYASGTTGATGWGSHPYSLGYARRRALAECAIRTPRHARCYLTGCN